MVLWVFNPRKQHVNKNLSGMSATATSKQADAPRFVSMTYKLKTHKRLDAFLIHYLYL